MGDIDYKAAFEAATEAYSALSLKYAKVSKKANRLDWVYNRLEEYAVELANTDYRGTPPVEHKIAEKLHEILYAWDHVQDNG